MFLVLFLATREKISSAACPTPGCKGIGHVKGAKYSTHHSTFGCPYSLQNLNKDSCLVDRLSNNSMTEESDWSYASKQKSGAVKEVKRKLSLFKLQGVIQSGDSSEVNLVPRAFPVKKTHFLREKPWGRGWSEV